MAKSDRLITLAESDWLRAQLEVPMEWLGHVAIQEEGESFLTDDAVTVKARGPAEAVERAVRRVLGGQPRRAERIEQVIVTLRRGA